MICVHCHEEHPDHAKFCSTTGKPTAPAPADDAATPDPAKGAFDLLQEAFTLYKAHARTLLVTAALLFVPGSFISSCAMSMVMAPIVGGARSAQQAAEELGRRSDELARQIQHAPRDPKAAEELARKYQESLAEMERNATGFARATLGGVTTAFFGLLGWAITALILYGLVLPLTHGALTIAVADRVLGGNASWREHWMLLFRRLGLLLSALLPAMLLLMLGYFCLVIPGIILSFLFAFVSPVVLIEGIGGTAALKRSYELVRSDWLRTAIILITFGLLSGIAHWLVGLFIPRTAIFFGMFLGDLLLLAVMPVPIIGSVLLYFDLRRKVDGISDDNLRAELEALRPAAV